jgi:transposase InsO family protein
MSCRQDRHEQWAVFWCSLLGPLLSGVISEQECGPFLRELAETEHDFPDGTRRKPARATLWRKWKQYREQGFQGLQRRGRNDRGRPRRATPTMIEKAILLKKDQPRRSDHTINQFLQEEFQATIPKSTLYRHLKRAGATRIKLGISRQKVRCRWTRDFSNALWLGDFQDGPYVWHDGQVVETHLSAFIDCHSRFILDARYYLRENLDILIDSLLRAWSLHGASRELYLDNAKIYHAHALRRACAALNIRLIHRGVGDAPPGGLIERFFETVQTQLEAEVRAGSILTLEKFNQALTAWLEMSYHTRPNSETRQPPRQRYEQALSFVRRVDIAAVVPYFFHRERRRVDRLYSDVRLDSGYFRVDPRLRGDWVQVRYDPFAPLEAVMLYSEEGEYLGTGQRYQREGPVQQPTIAPQGQPQHNYIDLLIRKHQQALDQAVAGIDYVTAIRRGSRPWPFLEFARRLATLLGRAGGLSAFRADELEMLHTIHRQLPRLNAELLDQACRDAPQRTLPEILFLLQTLHHERRP